MHPRNRYAKQKELDFIHLSKEYPPLLDHLILENSTDVKNSHNNYPLQFDPKVPGAVDALVTALIRVDFGVTSYKGVPNGNLVPSVTRSLNYIHFIEDLISEAHFKGVTYEKKNLGKDNIDQHHNSSEKNNESSTKGNGSDSKEDQSSFDEQAGLAQKKHVDKKSNALVQGDGSKTSDESDAPPVSFKDVDSNQFESDAGLKQEASVSSPAKSGEGPIQQPQKRIRIFDQEETKNTATDDAITIKGIDVGVGASCIFPILSCAMHPNWYFVGIDVDETVLEWARTNSLQFKDRIDLRRSERGPTPQIKCVLNDDDKETRFDFIMCNPPFFSHPDETYHTTYRFDFNGEQKDGQNEADDDVIQQQQQQQHERAFGGTDLERWCEGGEVGFVSGLIDESVELRHRVVWFTSMLGMKSSLNPVLAKLHQVNPQTIRVHRLEQGHRARWVVAWSFEESLAINPVRGRTIQVDNLEKGETLSQRIRSALEELRGFTFETGICGGSEGFRYRIQVVEMDDDQHSLRVDALDLKKGKNETDDDVRQRAISTIRKVEQGLERKSRRWRKLGGAKRTGGHHSRHDN